MEKNISKLNSVQARSYSVHEDYSVVRIVVSENGSKFIKKFSVFYLSVIISHAQFH